MPRGTPKAGFRRTKNWYLRKGIEAPQAGSNSVIHMAREEPVVDEIQTETDAEIASRIKTRFDIVGHLTNSAIKGDARAVIVSGPAGCGKSFSVEQALVAWDKDGEYHTINKGYVKATGLFRLLWNHREKNQVIVFDDADSIFEDMNALNILKAACDTTETRRVSWLSEKSFDVEDEEAESIPRRFVFEGTIIFLTNLDFDALITRGNRLAPHLEALISRAHYIDLSMKTDRDRVVRLRQVYKECLTPMGLTQSEQDDVMDFVDDNLSVMRELSLRMLIKLGSLRKTMGPAWVQIAKTTCCKNK